MREVDKLLSKIQKELKAPKSQYNSFGKYNYRNKEDILEGVKPHLVDGSYINIKDEIVLIGDRFYVKSTAALHLAGESVTATALAREAESKKGMDSSMLTGATSSYSGKYALSNLLALDDTKCSDHDSNHPHNIPPNQQQGQYYQQPWSST